MIEMENVYELAGRAIERLPQTTPVQLRYLAAAVSAGEPALFYDYLRWETSRSMKAGTDAVADDLLRLRRMLDQELPENLRSPALTMVDAGLQHLRDGSTNTPLDRQAPTGELASEYLALLLRKERAAAVDLILRAVASGFPIRDVYLRIFQPVLYEVGRLWQNGSIDVAEEHYCTAVVQLTLAQLYPRMLKAEPCGRRLVAASVSGELHEIGVRMVTDFFEMEGWNTCYLGASMPVPDLVNTVAAYNADVLCVSATMTYHVEAVKRLIAAVRESRECERVRIMVGGYPFTVASGLWRKAGADFCAGDAEEALALATQLYAA
jgi:MerR family transcriptional regulator, light-induced transcriptional regulator